MKEKILIKYRTWYKGMPPRRIKLEIPGWAGDSLGHSNGDKPQAWHCQPFVDGSTYGLELIYPFDAECRVSVVNGKLNFSGDFDNEAPWADGLNSKKPPPPFAAFAPGHYGFTSSLDIQPPDDCIVRLEPHPRFYTDDTGTVPIAVAGHLQSWWPKIFFVVFKAPTNGQVHIFRKGEPYAQVLILPRRIDYEIREMTPEENQERGNLDRRINHLKDYIPQNVWVDYIGNAFDDKYKQLSTAFCKNGIDGINKLLDKAAAKAERAAKNKLKIKSKFVKK